MLCGSQALAIPMPLWKGRWISDQSVDESYQQQISRYAQWLQANSITTATITETIWSDAREGLKYEADIPMGYGLGSSGAFVAALYDRYVKSTSTMDMQQVLAQMENYFHGASSGMDPLVSFTNKAVVRDEKGNTHIIRDTGWPEGIHAYLLDSGYHRSTSPLVHVFKTKLEEQEFNERIKCELIPMVDHAIHFYLNGHAEMMMQCLEVISRFQRTHFNMMIPEQVQKRWDELSSIPGVTVKLCGAGGGGFFLVIARDNVAPENPADLIRLS